MSRIVIDITIWEAAAWLAVAAGASLLAARFVSAWREHVRRDKASRVEDEE